ncbi:MAG: succinylglutamate desuccinylase/aspartoacylase family protein, partial [Ignavibacteria bacterium]|nr:succinylglutamate desuccinylase/aspartoacylase family protein [Ignavibacteria bacterium]
NIGALNGDQRYLRRDLNRMWSPKDLDSLRSRDPATDTAEEREQRELLETIQAELVVAEDPIIFIDLHSTSAGAPPFSVISDTLQNRRIAFALPIPVVLGLEEAVEGTLLSYFSEQGYVAVGVEGGQHKDPRTVDCHESAIWMTLVAAGILEEAEVPDFAHHRQRLQDATRGLPSAVEIIHRHGITPEDDLIIEEGFLNFDHVTRGQLLGRDVRGAVRAPETALLLLPRYQGLGDDGFFLGREVRLFWLMLSDLLRRIRLDRLLKFLPGVHIDPDRQNVLLANPRVTRWFAVEIFHLFGFRKCKQDGSYLVFCRRPEAHRT